MPKRKVIYPEPEVSIFEKKGDLFTEAHAKSLLGWTVLKGKRPKPGRYHFKDVQGNYIFCSNVELQRPYYMFEVRHIMWEILAGNWEFNFETVIIGRTGRVLDGKHRLTALVFACQHFANEPELYPFWEDIPKLEILIGLGAKETPKLVNTIGTGKARSIADSLFASGIFGADMDFRLMKRAVRVAEFAVRMLWNRTGAREDAYNPRISHAEALDFIDRHPYVITCVKTVLEENDGKRRRIARLAPLGAAAGLMYLMASAATEPENYLNIDHPTEDLLDLSLAEQAEGYWLALSKGEANVKPVIHAIAKLAEGGNMSLQERSAVLIKGWNKYQEVGEVRPSNVRVRTATDRMGNRVLVEHPTIGGVDIGT